MENSNENNNEIGNKQFVDVPVQFFAESKQKKQVAANSVGFSPDQGNLFVHLDDKHTLLMKKSFLQKYIKVGIQPVSEVEKSVKSAPSTKGKEMTDSTVRMKVLGERDGRTFVGPTGSVKYDSAYKGLMVNLDGGHQMIIDGKTLSRDLGLKLTPLSMENSRNGMSR